MKKIHFVLLAIVFNSFFVKAQITYLDSDYASVGDTFVYYHDTTGRNFIMDDFNIPGGWNFSILCGTRGDTVILLDPQLTAYGDSFPASNLAKDTNNVFYYFTKSSSKVETIGMVGDVLNIGVSMVLPFEDPIQIQQFPFTYESTYSDIGVVDYKMAFDTLFFDSIEVIINNSSNSEIDAYGNIELGIGTFNGLREKTMFITQIIPKGHISVPFPMWINISSPITDTTLLYRFFAREFGYPVIEIIVDDEDSVKSLSYFSSDTVTCLQCPTSILEKYLPVTEKVFPNPASDKIYIDVSNENTSRILVYDILGNRVMEKDIFPGEHSFNLVNFCNGIYICEIIDNKGKRFSISRFCVNKR